MTVISVINVSSGYCKHQLELVPASHQNSTSLKRLLGAFSHHSNLSTVMGAEQSLPVDLVSKFETDEIKRLSRSFKRLDLNQNGSLSAEEFLAIPELQQNPLVRRVIDILDTDRNGEVDFQEFIEGVSQFSVQGEREKKLMFAFRIYDIDQDGFISNGELFQVLKTMVGNNLTEKQLQEIVDKTILYADKDGDGKISYEEFSDVVGTMDVPSKMVVDLKGES